MVDNSTQNVTTTQSGTGWTVDVTPCNLDPDTSIKDFLVLIDGNVESNTNFNKLSQTSIEYTGPSISSSNVEIRRVTPPDRIQEVSFGAKFSSALWEAELNRQSRIAFESALNGAPGSAGFTAPQIKDDPFSSSWNGDQTDGASRNALYDEITLRAPKQSPTIDNLGLTAIAGNNTAPTVGISNDNNIIATTSFVHDRIDQDLSDDPTLGDGSTLNVSPSVSDDSDQIATTSFVHSRIDQDLSNDPQLGGGSSLASNPGTGSTGTQIATTQFVEDYIEGANFGTILGNVDINGDLDTSNLEFTDSSPNVTNPNGTLTFSDSVAFSSSVDVNGTNLFVENQEFSNNSPSITNPNGTLTFADSVQFNNDVDLGSANSASKPTNTDDSTRVPTTSWVNDVHNTDDSFVYAYMSSNQTVSSTGIITLNDFEEVDDDGNNFIPAPFNSGPLYDVPYDGIYQMTLTVRYTIGGNSSINGVQARLKNSSMRDSNNNTSSLEWLGSNTINDSTNSNFGASTVSVVARLSVNTQLEAKAFVDMGSSSQSIDLIGGKPNDTYFSIVCLKREA